MRRNDTILKIKMVFDAVVVAVSAIVGLLSNVVVIGVVVPVLMLLTGGLVYAEHKERQIQPYSESLQELIEDNVLDGLVDEYREFHPEDEPPDIRANVMFLRHRNINPFSGKRKRNDVRPWEKTLQIEAAKGDYTTSAEHRLEWKTDEGVVGRTMNKGANELWAKLDYSVDYRLKQGWNLTSEQVSRTTDLQSLLSVPIYPPGDIQKMKPIGVLNVDCQKPLSESHLGMEEIRQKVINRANLIGVIVQQ